MQDALQQAIECLQIQDVYQKNLLAFCAEDFEPKYDDLEKVDVSFMHVVRRSEVMALENDEETKRIFRVHIRLGVRWRELGAEEAESNEVDLAKIEGKLIAEYLMRHELTKEAMEVFAKQNASFHVWPYWREIVSSQCAKMNLPVIFMPAVQFAKHQDENVTK